MLPWNFSVVLLVGPDVVRLKLCFVDYSFAFNNDAVIAKVRVTPRGVASWGFRFVVVFTLWELWGFQVGLTHAGSDSYSCGAPSWAGS